MTTSLLVLGLCMAAEGIGVSDALQPTGAQDKLQQARANFDYRNYGPAADLAQELIDNRALERTSDQIEAYRILGLSRFFQGRTEESRIAFINLLSLDPDFQLDPFYVPPQAVSFFERVRADNQTLLQPIRERRRAAQEALRQEEEARARLLAQGQAAQPQIVREQIVRPSPAVALLPFGVGQFQNGNTALGVTFAVTEAVAAITSVSCYVWVESQRSSTGYFPSSVYSTAVTVRDVQIGAGIAFFVLWAGGAVEAILNLKGPTVVRLPESPAEGKPGVHASIVPTPTGASGALALDF
jgi:hypothetical protein